MLNISELNALISKLEEQKEVIREGLSSECPQYSGLCTCIHITDKSFKASVYDACGDDRKVYITVTPYDIQGDDNEILDIKKYARLLQVWLEEKCRIYYNNF